MAEGVSKLHVGSRKSSRQASKLSGKWGLRWQRLRRVSIVPNSLTPEITKTSKPLLLNVQATREYARQSTLHIHSESVQLIFRSTIKYTASAYTPSGCIFFVRANNICERAMGGPQKTKKTTQMSKRPLRCFCLTFVFFVFSHCLYLRGNLENLCCVSSHRVSKSASQ